VRTLAWSVSAVLAVMLAGCVGWARWLPAPEPMRSVAWPQRAAGPARCLVVFLPGLGDDADDFERHGLVADVQRRGLSADLIAASATIGYYARGTFLARLAADVIGPARGRGYAEVWLVGNSMGGLGTVYYARAHTAEITGVLALAPFLGDADLIHEIDDQGGLAGWQAPPRVAAMTEDNYQRELWRWLQAVIRGQEPGPDVYLGFGMSDKLAHQDALLADALPDDHTFLIPGAHDWKTWRRLFDQFLDDSDFTRRCRQNTSSSGMPARPTRQLYR
jgi:pimeloyl-ACP methyl ester carboxylesterase